MESKTDFYGFNSSAINFFAYKQHVDKKDFLPINIFVIFYFSKYAL